MGKPSLAYLKSEMERTERAYRRLARAVECGAVATPDIIGRYERARDEARTSYRIAIAQGFNR